MWTIFWLIWFVLSAFVLAVYGWSMKILFEQKEAWKKFAEKHKLDYKSEKLTAPPYLTGRYKDHRLYAYSGVQVTTDVSGQRFVTIIEIELGKGIPVAGAVGTENLGRFILGLNFEQEYVPNSEYWDTAYTLKTRNAAVLKKYLTEKRLQALQNLFKMKNASVLFFFDDVESVLRIETPDPLRNADRMEKIFDRIYKALDVLIVTDQEFEQLEKEGLKKAGKKEPADNEGDKETGTSAEKTEESAATGQDQKAESKEQKENPEADKGKKQAEHTEDS